MSNQVLDIEQMKHLKELGVDTNKATMCWKRNIREVIGVNLALVFNVKNEFRDYKRFEYIPCFTLQDILDLLPTHISDNSGSINILNIEQQIQDWTRVWNISYLSTSSFIKIVSSINNEFIDAAYEMLCWCAENGYLKQMNHDTRRIP